MSEIAAIAVVIPAHNEEQLIADCLASVQRAAELVRGIPVGVWLALDACTDATAARAKAFDVHTVTIDAGRVGIARMAGIAAAQQEFAHIAPEKLWIANTDADSTVPEQWLTHQIDLAARGADVFVGTVRPDFRDLDKPRRKAWLATHTPGVANGHVHGANLGVRASTLVGAGGFEPIGEHEDVRLVEAARARGANIVASADARVRTSGRQVGRTAGGYARYLRDDLLRLADGVAV
jgi:glycosyltransferase involved in cell wall biosynthesis